MITINVGTQSGCKIDLGIRGENEARQIAFDLSWLIQNYGNGVGVILVKRATDEEAYPAANINQSGVTLTWVLSNVDTGVMGKGRAELFWYVDETLAKTIVYPTWVAPDIIGTSTEPPDPYDSWLEQLAEYTAQIRAEGTAYSQESEAWAVGEKGGVPVASSDETYENNSKYYAEQASLEADRAEQGAATAGWMEMDINEDGHLILTRTSNTAVSFSLDSDGHLIMEAI